MEFIFDTETTGLPQRSGYRLPDYKQLTKYEGARLVSISWLIVQRGTIVNQAYFIIRPDGFTISEESIKIHGITQEQANEEGCNIITILKTISDTLLDCSTLVAHNIDFDIHILMSELYRYDMQDTIEALQTKHMICTMKKGRDILGIRAYPKLAVLYKSLYGEDMVNAHNAEYDTHYCYKCYVKMFPVNKSIFFFGNKPVTLTDVQMDIVYEAADKNILVIACAGAGKTMTVICRIKHLIESGVSEKSIMLTTFTRDAATDMKTKLFAIMGYTPEITVGTIDSIARRYTNRSTKRQMKDVSEYSHDFLKEITNNPSIISHYKYLFVDEFQDINDEQFSIIKVFYDNKCKIFAVGDDAQNIYTFRGSKIEFILNFDKYFENSTRKMLMQNFRSTKQIINLGNASIEKNENNISKQMYSGQGLEGRLPHVEYFESTTMLNAHTVAQIKHMIKQGVPEHDIVVLSPINYPLYQIEELLTKSGINNVLLDGKCDVKTSKKLWHVCLCTIHKSKGLEWDKAIIIGVNDEILPKSKSPASVEEARRLFYVGVTRAKTELYMYYTTMNQTQPFVSRFVSELERNMYTTKSMIDPLHFGISDMEVVPTQLAVTKLIENLNGQDYVGLKEKGIIPVMDKSALKKVKLYESFEYSAIIENNDLHSDFGIFVEKVIKRCFAVVLQQPLLCIDKECIKCLANLKLDSHMYDVYKCYKNNFKQNMRHVSALLDNIMRNRIMIKRVLEKDCKNIIDIHMGIILDILSKIKHHATKFNIEPHEVPVFSQKFLLEGFETMMKDSLNIYGDIHTFPTLTETVLKETWEVAKCTKIVKDYRRRLLYKKVDWADLAEYTQLFRHIEGSLMKHFTSSPITYIATSKDYHVEQGIYGEIDMLIDNTIIDFKTSINDDVTLQWMLQLLCYKTLVDLNTPDQDQRVRKVGIMNPLKGWYTECDVSTWDKHEELVRFLMGISARQHA